MKELEQSRLRSVLQWLCPHWWWPVPDYTGHVLMEVTKSERCRICGKFRVHAKLREPHPSRDKDEHLEELQHPGHEFIVEEWLPYQEEVSEA